jgi:putative nucleotidyltransferase with HDIG domain
MIEIELSLLQEGQIVDHELFDASGEVLFHKGSRITREHLDRFRQKNITKAFFNDNFHDEELNKILTTEFKSFEDLDLDLKTELSLVTSSIPDVFSELQSIKSGKEGLLQLLEDTRFDSLEEKIKNGFSDKPVGSPLKDNAQQIKDGERKESDKIKFKNNYEQSLDKTKSLLNTLANGDTVSMESIRYIVSLLVHSFLMDRDFLLNLSTVKCAKGDYIYHHSLNVSILAINIAASYGFNEQQVLEIGMGSLLHDVGMLLIPEEIRFKKERVTEEEWYEVQKHPILGLHILEKIERLPAVISIAAYQTHERENGKGYPKQRSSRLIHPFAKITAVADVFEALSSPRSYRGANIPYKAMELIIKMTRQGFLSGEYVKSLLEYSSLFPVGSLVELSNGCIAKVIRSNGTSFAKPAVCVLTDRSGATLPTDKRFIEDLSKNISIQIIRAYSTNLDDVDVMSGF